MNFIVLSATKKTYCVNFHVGVVDSASTIFSISHAIFQSSVRVWSCWTLTCKDTVAGESFMIVGQSERVGLRYCCLDEMAVTG